MPADDKVDLGDFLDSDVYPALWTRLDIAFPEFGFQQRGENQTATRWPDGFLQSVKHKNPERLRCHLDHPYFLNLHGHHGLTWLAYINQGANPRGVEFIEAVRTLCDKAGETFPERELTEEERERARQREARRAILETAFAHARGNLTSGAGEEAREYLRERGLSAADCERLEIGLYLSRGDMHGAMGAAGHAAEDVDDAAILWRKLEGYVLFPWRDANGAPLTLYGKWPGPGKAPGDGRPKTLALYKGPKWSPLYFDRARRAGHRDLVAVEGVTDAAVAQVQGDTRVVAYVAAEFSKRQVETLKRLRISTVTIAPDPDGGGDRGAISCVAALTRAGIRSYVAPRLPDDLDPDEFILRDGLEAWRAHVDAAIPGPVHAAWVALGDVTPESPPKTRREAAQCAWEAAEELRGPDVTQDRADILELVAERTGYDREDLHGLCGSATPAPGVKPSLHSGMPDDGRGWPPLQELPPRTPPVPHLGPELLPEPLRAWLVDEAERASLPLEMVAAPALVSLSSVVGRMVGIRPGARDSWTVVPNLWGAIVADPGNLKSHAIDVGLAPLRPLADEARRRFSTERIEADAHQEAVESQIQSMKRKAGSRGPTAIDEGELIRLKTDLEETRAVERRFWTNDATTEKLAVLLVDNPRGLLVYRDELTGWLAEQDKPGRQGARSFYLKSWDGKQGFQVDRIGRGSLHVPVICLAILGSIQPGPLREVVTEAAGSGRGADGLLQRIQILVWPDSLGDYRRSEHGPDVAAQNRAFRVYRRLADGTGVDLGAAVENCGSIPFLRFDRQAQDRWNPWREDLENRIRSGELASAPAFAAALGKYRSLVPSLALLDHLVTRVEGATATTVGVDSTERAIVLSAFLERHARKVYAVEIDRGATAAHRLAEKIGERAIRDGETVREIGRNGWKDLGRAAVALGLRVLEQAGWLRVERRQTGGRPSYVIVLRPDLAIEDLATDRTANSDETPAGLDGVGAFVDCVSTSTGWTPEQATHAIALSEDL